MYAYYYYIHVGPATKRCMLTSAVPPPTPGHSAFSGYCICLFALGLFWMVRGRRKPYLLKMCLVVGFVWYFCKPQGFPEQGDISLSLSLLFLTGKIYQLYNIRHTMYLPDNKIQQILHSTMPSTHDDLPLLNSELRWRMWMRLQPKHDHHLGFQSKAHLLQHSVHMAAMRSLKGGT